MWCIGQPVWLLSKEGLSSSYRVICTHRARSQFREVCHIVCWIRDALMRFQSPSSPKHIIPFAPVCVAWRRNQRILALQFRRRLARCVAVSAHSRSNARNSRIRKWKGRNAGVVDQASPSLAFTPPVQLARIGFVPR
jgi:hypothetical protein